MSTSIIQTLERNKWQGQSTKDETRVQYTHAQYIECHVAAIRYSSPVDTSILDTIYGANMPPSTQGSQKCKLIAFSINWYYFFSENEI